MVDVAQQVTDFICEADFQDDVMPIETRSYIWQQSDWPDWQFDSQALTPLLAEVHQAQQHALGDMERLNPRQRKEMMLQSLTDDVLSTSAIEGERLDAETVRAFIVRQLDRHVEKKIGASRQIDGIVNMVLDATINYTTPLTAARLFSWHDALFPTSYSIISRINTESWRDDITGPMRVVSGPIGQQKIHYEAPPAQRLNDEMKHFLHWFNAPATTDPIIKAGLAHLWFLTIHPFGDGNGRIARAINEIALARVNKTSQRFYSCSVQIQRERNDYYDMLERSQKGSLDVTAWLRWYLACLRKSINAAWLNLNDD